MHFLVTFTMFGCKCHKKTALQSVVACKGSDNLWLELFTKEVHTPIMFLSTAHDLYGFNHVYIGQNKIFTHATKSSGIVWAFVQFIRLMNDTFKKESFG